MMIMVQIYIDFNHEMSSSSSVFPCSFLLRGGIVTDRRGIRCAVSLPLLCGCVCSDTEERAATAGCPGEGQREARDGDHLTFLR